MTRRIITLTTDFGLSDHFVGVMKGVIASVEPAAQVIDITHGIQPYAITEGAFTIAQAFRHFPKKTIHVVVVDPGVGSARRPILAEVEGQYFIAPDNGVLSMVLGREGEGRGREAPRRKRKEAGGARAKVRHITAERYFLRPVSRTFHGRDIFSPVAAHLAAGVMPAQFGKLIEDYIHSPFDKPEPVGKNSWTGTILKADHFGNLFTNFHIDRFPFVRTHAFSLNTGQQTITRLALTFSDCAPGELFVVVGSSGYLEVAAGQDSAARLLGCGAGSRVKLTIY